jgi:myo-inositol-1(or 4)-monophosphatase
MPEPRNPPHDDITRRLAAAEAAVREAGALALRMQAQALEIEWKGELDFVTPADHALEALLTERLAAPFGDAVFGEEAGGAMADPLWIVDPIDGTYNYAHGLPHWCVSVGFVAGGALELGVIYDPVRDELFAARRGHGATLNGAAIRVAGATAAERPLVEIGASNRLPFADYLALVGRVVASGCEFRRLGSGALGMAWVAAGRSGGYCELHINAWDVVAGLLLVREAGGWTNDFLAGDWLRRGNPVIGCTPVLRDTLSGLSGIGDTSRP